MITLNQSPGNNNDIIWVLRILTDNPIYIASRAIALDNTYISALNSDLGDIYQVSSISQGGGSGEVSSFNFNISRYLSNASLDGFFNEFFPASGGERIVSKIVDFGFCWAGATTDDEITWLIRGRIVRYKYLPRYLSLSVLQESAIINKQIPYYSIQKDFDNGISYLTKASSDVMGKTVPIIYGDFAKGAMNDGVDYGMYEGFTALAPCIPVFPRASQFFVCSHKVFLTANDEALLGNQEWVMKYIEGVKAYLHIRNNDSADSITYNDNRGHSFRLTQGGNYLLGYIIIRLTEPSDASTVADIDNAIDQKAISTYSEVDAGEVLSLRPIGNAGTDEIGFLGLLTEDVNVYFWASTDGGGNRSVTTNFANYNLTTPTAGAGTTVTLTSSTPNLLAVHQFGDDITAKINSDIPWTIEEICGLDYQIANGQLVAGQKIRVYSGFIYLNGIKVQYVNQARPLRNSGLR